MIPETTSQLSPVAILYRMLDEARRAQRDLNKNYTGTSQ